jgi:hypothetical protein
MSAEKTPEEGAQKLINVVALIKDVTALEAVLLNQAETPETSAIVEDIVWKYMLDVPVEYFEHKYAEGLSQPMVVLAWLQSTFAERCREALGQIGKGE